MKLILRAATAADAARVADLLIDTRTAFMPYAPAAHSEADIRAWVGSHLLPAGAVLVAEVAGGNVVGVMATESTDRATTSWITQMAVDPGMVGRRIGSALLAHAIDTLARPIHLYTFQQNTGARRFYERHGFQAIQFSDGEDNEEKCPAVLYELCG